ncbi:MAG: 30S ribosomal protein S13 [Candidatus Shapirobacteria bacterium]
MARIAGIDLNNDKRIDIALTALYGIGRQNVKSILFQAKIGGEKRVKSLTAIEINRIQKVVDTVRVEGSLRVKVAEDIKRLKMIGSYRGMRHTHGLPARGQRTRSNARTKRGRRKTVGALKKEDAAKMTPKKEEKKK